MSTPTYRFSPLHSKAIMDAENRERTRARRLAEARSRHFRSARAAAMHFRWPESTYRSHENGTRNFNRDDAERYAQAFEVGLDWLWGADSRAPGRTVQRFLLPNATIERETVRLPTKQLPVLGRALGGTDGALVMTDQAVDEVDCPPGLDIVPDAYAVYVVGSSMEPRYFPGEVVFVHPYRPCKRGDFVVVQVRGDGGDVLGYIKQFVTATPSVVVLRQLSPDQEIEFPRDTVLSIHRIVFSGENK